MDMVNNDWNARAFGREAAENARLAAVSMDDVRFLPAQDFFQPAEREKIFQRMHRPDEFGNHRQEAWVFRCNGFQRTFWAGRWSGNQFDFDAGLMAQAEDSGDGVFLGAADDEPRDDVGDFQIVDCLNS